MADSRRYGFRNRLDVREILLEAQHRWLRPAEICEILQNYKDFQIAPEPATMPPSGSLFLFDRKVLRYFRKDGHNWRKKKDGKTVKEAHERLKAGSVDVLHCYYAHGEENENFQRRSYWLLEEELSHIVLVHYLEVKGNRMSLHRIREAEELTPSIKNEASTSYEIDSSLPYKYHKENYQIPSQTTEISSNSGQASEYEDVESSYSNQASTTVHSPVGFQQAGTENDDGGPSHPYYPIAYSADDQENLSVIPGMDLLSLTRAEISTGSNGAGLAFEHQRHLDLPSWGEVLGNFTPSSQAMPLQPSVSSGVPHTSEINHKQGHDILGQLFTDSFGKKQGPGSQSLVQEWQWLGDNKLHSDSIYEVSSKFHKQGVDCDNSLVSVGSCEPHLNKENVDIINEGNAHQWKSDLHSDARREEKSISPSPWKHPFSDALAEENLKKMDSFNRWMSKELNELHVESGTAAYWDPVEGENGVDSNISSQDLEHAFTLSPSLSQEQLFSITDFSPNWACAGLEVKVLISGRFLKSREEVASYKWSCMFGEVEVLAEVIADGVLRCHAPVHKAGRVPFYVTCSNRLACSEVREFEYCVNQFQEENTGHTNNGSTDEVLKMRFGKLLCLSSMAHPNSDFNDMEQKSQLSSKICSLLKDDNGEWDQMLRLTSEEGSLEIMREQLLQKLLKENLYSWLLVKAVEGGKGASVLDEEGQGVLHFAAALGYDWAFQPTITAGVSVNFRDSKGWTALHWAAYCGRERTVGFLISLGAAPGALTDPTPKYPRGRTPADLASSNGHKGIAGYLAESSLSAHLSFLNLDQKEGDAAHSPGDKAVQTISERYPTPCTNGDLPCGLSMKDSLAAVCNATQAAARIHQVFRLQSFQRKMLKGFDEDKFGISDERALSLVTVKPSKPGQNDDTVQAAAIRIQNKFRGWKGRKEFLIIRQQIVKIQAHVRGHQVRNKHKKITWSVGILEKVILRWRRKGSGLRGFKSEKVNDTSSMLDDTSSNGDDLDFLKEGRKQTEERLQKALARVKSMVQYPEARDQYRRLLNVVSEIQEAKGTDEMASTSYEEMPDYDDNINIEDLLDEADRWTPMIS